jgi:hypothetical protein
MERSYMDLWALLNADDFLHLFADGISERTQIEICCSKLRRTVRVTECPDGLYQGQKVLYVFNGERMIWELQGKRLNEILTVYVGGFLAKSCETLKKDCPSTLCILLRDNDLFRETGEEKVDKRKDKLFQSMLNSTFGKFIAWQSALYTKLDAMMLDQDRTGIHFQNGRFDLLNGTFEERNILHVDGPMITKTADCIYVPIPDELFLPRMQGFHGFLSNIFREPDVLQYVSSVMGRALLGDVLSCDLLFLYGEGSNGKSTVVNLIQKTLGSNYCFTIASNGLESTEANWTATNITPTHRYLIWDEPVPHTKKSSGFFKGVCNGKLKARKMHQGNSETYPIYAKMFVTANNYITFDSGDAEVDGGIRRRLFYYRCKNRFTTERPDPDNFVYPADPIGQDTTELSLDQKMVIFHYFAYYARLPLFPRPSLQVMVADQLCDLPKLVRYALIPDANETVSSADFHRLVDKIFKFKINKKQEATTIKALEDLNICYDSSKFKNTLQGTKKNGILVGVKWSHWALDAFNFRGDLYFSELPQEPKLITVTESEPITEPMNRLMIIGKEEEEDEDL